MAQGVLSAESITENPSTRKGENGEGTMTTNLLNVTTETLSVYTDSRVEGVEIHWRGGATFTVWSVDCDGNDLELDAFTVYGEAEPGAAPTRAEALDAARRHFDYMVGAES